MKPPPEKPWDYDLRRGLLPETLEDSEKLLKQLMKIERRNLAAGLLVGFICLFGLFGPYIFPFAMKAWGYIWLGSAVVCLAICLLSGVMTDASRRNDLLRLRLLPFHVHSLRELSEAHNELDAAIKKLNEP